MIKNDAQLARAETRLKEVEAEVRDLEKHYTWREAAFWARPLRDEADRLRAEIEEYHRLRKLSLTEAVEGPLQEPVLLENISELLAKLRIAAGLTQDAMATRLAWQQSNLSRFENENYSSQTVAKISEYIGALGVYLHVTPSMTERPPKLRYRKETGQFPHEFKSTGYMMPVFLVSNTLAASGSALITQAPPSGHTELIVSPLEEMTTSPELVGVDSA